MGKDQELLEAARCGNYAVVERILNQRAKKTGPLARYVLANIYLLWFYTLCPALSSFK